MIHNIPNYIFRLRQGAKEPEQPRTAAINTNLEDLGEETIKDILAGGNGIVDSAKGNQVPESFCKTIFMISNQNFVGKSYKK